MGDHFFEAMEQRILMDASGDFEPWEDSYKRHPTEYVVVEYESILVNRPKALLFDMIDRDDCNEDVWLPKSQIRLFSNNRVKVPIWLLKKKDFAAKKWEYFNPDKGYRLHDGIPQVYVSLSNDTMPKLTKKPTKPKGRKTMTIENVAAIIYDQITTCEVVMMSASASTRRTSQKLYTYKILRTTAERLAEDDVVIVSTSAGIRLGILKEIHEMTQIDIDDELTFQWVITGIDVESELASLREREETITAALRKHQRDHLRRQTLAAVGIENLESLGLDILKEESEDDG